MLNFTIEPNGNIRDTASCYQVNAHEDDIILTGGKKFASQMTKD